MMRAFRTLLALAVIALVVPTASAADKIRVVATIPDLKALTEEGGGKLVGVDPAPPAAPPARRSAHRERPRAGLVGRRRRPGSQQSEHRPRRARARRRVARH